MVRRKKNKYTSALLVGGGFAVGFVFSAAIFIVLVTYPIHDNRFLNGISYGLRASVDAVFNWGRKEAYGRIDTIEDGMITLSTNRAGIVRTYRVRFDENTKFYTFAADAELSEVLLTPSDIAPGEYASITTKEPVGSVNEQIILSVLIM
jgi:hypothetical protein